MSFIIFFCNTIVLFFFLKKIKKKKKKIFKMYLQKNIYILNININFI